MFFFLSFFHILLCSLSSGKTGLVALLFIGCDVCPVCHGLFALTLSAVGSLCSVIVATPGHLFHYFSDSI